MYFCEDHTSFSEDGTVRYCGDNDNDTIANLSNEDLRIESDACAPYTFGHDLSCMTDTCDRVLCNAEPKTVVQENEAPPESNGCVNDTGPTQKPTPPDQISDQFADFCFQDVEGRSYSAPNSPRNSTCSSPLLRQTRGRQRVVSTSENPPPPPYPGGSQVMLAGSSPQPSTHQLFNGLHRTNSNKTFVVPSVGTSYPFQEIREISLGRHNEEPFGMKVESIGDGFYITHVVRGSVAACAGLKMGDEIARINDRRLDGLKTKEVLQIIRESDVCVKLAYKPRAVVARIREVKIHKNNGVLGLRLQRRSDGIFIDFVKKGTPAFTAGLKDSDQVLKINGHVVTEWSMEGAMALLKSVADNEQLVLVVRETLPLAHVSPAVNGQPSPCLSRRPSTDPQSQRTPSDLTSTSLSSSQTGAEADPSAKNSSGNPCISRSEPGGTELTSLPSNDTSEPASQIKTSQHTSKFSFFKSSKNSFKQSGSLSSASSVKEKG